MAVPSQPVEGFYFDELSKVRVIEPDTAEQTQELKDECKEFVDSELFLYLMPSDNVCTLQQYILQR